MTDTDRFAVAAKTDSVMKSRRGRRILGLVLIALVLLLGLSSYLLFRLVSVPTKTRDSATSGSQGLTWIRSIYGVNDTVQGSLERAQAAVPAADGSIWVTDGIHRSLLHFTVDGRYLGEVTGPTASPLDLPSRFAIGPDGLFYVCETAGDAIAVLDSNNRDAGSFKIPRPVSVAVSEDRIVVGAISGFAILDKEGKPIKVMGSRGKGDDQFDYVHGVAIGENGNIYVADSYNNRLSAYDREGKRLWIVRTGKPSNSADMSEGSLTIKEPVDATLTGADALQLPLGLTLDGAGRIVVIDMFDCSLAVFNAADGSFVGKYGDVGPNDGEFFYPVSVGYDTERDWFTVADALNNRVQIIRIPGSSGGGNATAAVRRALAGPLRACVFPFLLLLLAIIVWAVMRARRGRGSATLGASGEVPDIGSP